MTNHISRSDILEKSHTIQTIRKRVAQFNEDSWLDIVVTNCGSTADMEYYEAYACLYQDGVEWEGTIHAIPDSMDHAITLTNGLIDQMIKLFELKIPEEK
jgi:hypothetical protein